MSVASVSNTTLTTTTFGDNRDYAFAEGVQSDGKIVVAGTANLSSNPWSGSSTIALARYNPDLTLDTSFGNGGKVTTSIAPSNNTVADALAIDNSTSGNIGKLVAAGSAVFTIVIKGFGKTPNLDFAVARYTAAGSLDPTFGGGKGYTTVNVSGAVKAPDDEVRAVAIDTTSGANYDKIVAAGYASNGTYKILALARFTASGTLDTTFNPNGKMPGTVTLDLGSSGAVATSVAVDAQGNYLVGGTQTNSVALPWGPTSASVVFLTRFKPDGTLDTSFGTNGTVSLPEEGIRAIALDAAGNIVAVGSGSPNPQSVEAWVARFTSTGALDPSFGNGAGYVFTDLSAGLQWGRDYSVTIDPGTGDILGAGYGVRQLSDGTRIADFAVARYLPTGTLDTSFNGTGTLLIPFPNDVSGSGNFARGVVITPAGHVTLAGYFDPGNGGPAMWSLADITP